MKRLVLDLRSNPGGQLDQAIRMVNLFVPRGSMIVYTDGRVPNSDQEYRATENGQFLTGPMIVLVNRNSASASEIVAGALQDYDRALVVGETTFGKALVQSVYRVSQGAGLALTTARYFTPSGRMIQRPWDGSFDEYLTYTLKDQAERPHTAGAAEVHDRWPQGVQRRRHRARSPVRRTSRRLQALRRSAASLFTRQLFASYAEQFTAEGDTRAGAQGKNRKVVRRGFTVDDAMLAGLQAVRHRTQGDDRRGGLRQGQGVHSRDDPLRDRRRAVQRRRGRQRLMADDPQAQFALTLFPEAEKLSELAKSQTTKVGQ